jgi:hypothetical protein
MRRGLSLLALLPLLACGAGETAALGQLETPVAVAVHQASNRVFIANYGSDELKVFDPTATRGGGSFVLGPAVLFALSIPTVPAPADLGAADRHLFVLSRDGAEVGFVDLEAEGTVGPRSIDGPDGFPVTQALPFAPTSLVAFASRYPAVPGGTGDHALVAGLASAELGEVVAVRPPGADGRPSLVARVELPGVFPADLALEPRGEGEPESGEDCRTLAVSDVRFDRDGLHRPGVWLTRVRVAADGTLRLEGSLAPGATSLSVPVPLSLLDGTTAVREAPVRASAFVPAPAGEGVAAAVAADPCAVRSGRLVVLLDDAYCEGADPRTCPDVAVLDLPSGEVAADLAGGLALYAIPGSAQAVKILSGPLSPNRAYAPVVPEGAEAAPALADVPALALVTSADGGVYFFAPGLGTYLVGPTAADRAPTDPAFAVDGDPNGPRSTAPVRTDARRRVVAVTAPTPDLAGGRPRDETFSTGFLAPLPGLEDLGPAGALPETGTATVTVPAEAGVTFLAPVPVRVDPDPALSDRVVPVPDAGRCAGYPITAVSPDGLTVTVELLPQEQEACRDPRLPLAVVPAEATPWWLDGSVTGFVGRLGPEGGQVWGGDAPLFTFVPPAIPAEEVDRSAGATWTFTTDAGFAPYGAFPETDFQLPADIDAWLRTPATEGGEPDWRVFVPYAGGDALIQFNPDSPPPLSTLRAYQ